MSEVADLLERQVRVLLAVAEATNASLDRRTVLEEILAAMVREMRYRAAVIRLLDVEQGTLELAAAKGLSDEYLNKGAVLLAQSGIDRQALAGETVVLDDMTTDRRVPYPAAAEREGLRSCATVPLRREGKVVGVLRVFTAEPHDFSASEQALLSGLANLAARAIANAQIYQAFRTIAHEVNSTLEVNQVLRDLLQSLVRVLNVKAAAVRLLGPKGEHLHLAASEGLSQDYLAKGEIRVADSPIDRRVLAENQPVALYDIASEPGFQYPHEAEREGIRSVLAAPLHVRDRIMGVLRVYSGQPHRFTTEEIALIEGVSDLGAIALDNARLHEELQEKYQQAREDWSGWFRYLAFS